MGQVQQGELPFFAPLSAPLVEHLYHYWVSTYWHMLPASEKETMNPLATFFEIFSSLQQATFQYMETYLQAGKLRPIQKTGKQGHYSTRWLLETLGMHTPRSKGGKVAIPPQTLSDWRGKGLLRFSAHGLPELSSAAALLIARQCNQQRERGWLPSFIHEREPWWWCWSQAAPTMPPEPCPFPLPLTLAPSTLVWTTWAGASWEPEWIPISSAYVTNNSSSFWKETIGAIRFAGASVDRLGKLTWKITQQDLLSWDPQEAALLPPASPLEMIQGKAYYILQKLAFQRFSDGSLSHPFS